jgi:ABC-type spermidine/putrescine transport system permease subunit I
MNASNTLPDLTGIPRKIPFWKKPHLLLLSGPTLFFFLFLVLPLFFMLVVSFFKYQPMKIYVPQITVDSYLRFIGDPFYRKVLWYTLKLSFAVTFLSLLVGYPLAYFLARTQSRRKGLYLFLLLVPLMVGIIVRTYGWIVILGKNGLINNLLMALSIIERPIPILFTHTAVLVGIVEVLLPYMVLPIVSSIQKIPFSLEEAASSLGANRWSVLGRVVLPQSLPGVISGSVLVFTLTAGAIVTPALLGGPQIHTMGTVIFQLMVSTLNWPFGSASAFILLIMEFAIVFGAISLLLPITRRGKKV